MQQPHMHHMDRLDFLLLSVGDIVRATDGSYRRIVHIDRAKAVVVLSDERVPVRAN